MIVQSIFDGTNPKLPRAASDQGPSGIPSTRAATPESIQWTRSRYERSVAARHSRIAFAAFLMAEARGFEPGHEADDWLAAQLQIDSIDSGLRQA